MRIDFPRSGRDGWTRWLPSWRQSLAAVALALIAGAVSFVVAYAVVSVPSPSDLASAQATTIYFNDGKTVIARVADANRTSIPLTEVPDGVQKAVLAAEDRDFYDHGGFSASAMVRAAWNNFRGGATQGGSTITQQYAKNAYLTQDRTFSRKAKELLLAVKLSQTRSKERILEDYLNTIYFGRGAYGIEAASEAYFGKPASQLSTREGAVLASLIRSPAGYSPEDNKDRLVGRFGYVLDGMVDKGWLSQKRRERQRFPVIVAKGKGNRLSGDTGFMVDMVRKEMARLGFNEDQIARGGYRITTTFDQGAMAAARQAVDDKQPQSGTKGLRIGLAAVQPGTGAVLAIYGGDDYLKDQFNNATMGLVQAGSTFKPFALAAALEQGVSIYDRFTGINGTTFTFDGFQPYKVYNEDFVSYGPSISLLTATSQSVNTAYVDLEKKITPEAVVDSAVRAGIPGDTAGLNAGPTTVLGTSSPHTIDMATAYATFAARGLQASPFVVIKVQGANGGVLYQKRPEVTRAYEEGIAADVTTALQRVVTSGTGFAARSLGEPSAGKTGTTNSNLSAWYVGYIPEVSAAVSMARSSPSGGLLSLRGAGGLSRVNGGSYPARIWTAFVRNYLDYLASQQVARVTLPPAFTNGGNRTGTPRPTRSALPTPTGSGTPLPKPSSSPTVAPTVVPTSTSTPPP